MAGASKAEIIADLLRRLGDAEQDDEEAREEGREGALAWYPLLVLHQWVGICLSGRCREPRMLTVHFCEDGEAF